MKVALLQSRVRVSGIRVFSKRAGRVDISMEQLEELKARGLQRFPIPGLLSVGLGREIPELKGVPMLARPVRRLTGYTGLAGYLLVSEIGWALQGEYGAATLPKEGFKQVAERVVGKPLYWHQAQVDRLDIAAWVLTDREKPGFSLYMKRESDRFDLVTPRTTYALKGTAYLVVPVSAVQDDVFAYQMVDNPFTSFFSDKQKHQILQGNKKKLNKLMKFYSEVGVSLVTDGRYSIRPDDIARRLTSHAVTSLGRLFKQLEQDRRLTASQRERFISALRASIDDPTGRKSTSMLTSWSKDDFETFRYYVLNYEGRPVF